ncbi:MAG: hypothetical protein A2498_17005 [Lentisphaerae bacterium RIFOXYC12_FULL_60_16]|nr:MAG: hypothetical protein A2498_17005 [Lentisphaerae bacterium RIFOXYC12_FULL_60_16]
MRKRTMTLRVAVVCALMVSGPITRAAVYTGGSGGAYSMDTMTSDVELGGAVAAIASASNQSFARGYTPRAIGMITITDDPVSPGIKSGTPVVIHIPSGLAMTWDETDTTATFGGTAAGKVGTISYAGSNKQLVIAVTGDFAAGDTLTIADLSFKNYLGSGTGHLEMDFDNDGGIDSQDDKTVTILGAFHYGGMEDGYAMDAMLLDRDMRIHGTLLMVTKNVRHPRFMAGKGGDRPGWSD